MTTEWDRVRSRGKDNARVVLTVYLRAPGKAREVKGTYKRDAAALRLRWSRGLEDFKGHKTEAV